MMTYQTLTIANYRNAQAIEKAEARRLLKAATAVPMERRPTAVIDAVGHGLIAIGSRLIGDTNDHPVHRRAA